MLGQTYTEETNINNNEWKLGNMLGQNFENHIFNVLSRNLEKYYEMGAKIYHTPRVKDNGKDIIIESPVSLENILGTNFYKKSTSDVKIYIECKSSEHKKISYDSFAGNLSRISGDNIGYYVLVTNTTIVPYSYYQFEKEAKKLGIEFILIDQFLLWNYLVQNKAMIGIFNPPDTFNPIYIEYQANSCIIEAKKAYEIYFWIRNYSDVTQSISMQISTDRNWYTDISDDEQIVEAGSSRCLKFVVIKEYFDGIDDLILSIKSNFFDTSIQIKGINISYDFRPDLTGEKNKKIIESLKEAITQNKDGQFYFLSGEAGVGKTRITDEIQSLLIGRNISFYRTLVEKDKDGFAKLYKLLSKDGYINANTNYGSLDYVLKSIDTTYRKCVIIIDDIHNASAEILNNINNLIKTTLPSGLTLLFVGRDDYSVGNVEYFSFLQLCKEKYPANMMSLEALTDLETVNLIESIVRGIPSVAAQKIQSLSNNLPLYVIQVIEYMLDLKLVYLLNRNTVGIENTDNFSSHLYIPCSMEELYSQRIGCLTKQKANRELPTFLYIAAFIGIDFPLDFVNVFFEGKEELLKILLERRYIYPSSKGYRFMHESLYLYLRKQLFEDRKEQKKTANWLINVPFIFNGLNSLEQGKLYLWLDDIEKSLTVFSDVILEINSVQNYSSININPGYYNYLEDIYKISPSYEQQKKVIACRIYIALHYHTPFEAVAICSWAQQELKKNKQFKKDPAFAFHLKEQIAHSYINAGQLKKGEFLLEDLLSQFVLNTDDCDCKAVFDMYDKLSNIYIKYNVFSIAQNYCSLSFSQATKLKDSNLQALSYITTAKLYLYTNKKKSKKYLDKAKKLLTEENAHRIKCHNDVSLLIMSLMMLKEKNSQNLIALIKDAECLLNICIKNNFANSVIRIYLLLAILHYYLNIKTDEYSIVIKYINKGIDASIKFGISTYIWQFYNLKAIIYVRQHFQPSEQKNLFDTVFNMLKRQNLTYLGNCDFTYGNILALTNIMFFYRNNTSENIFYQKINQLSLADSIDVCDFNCNKDLCKYECHTNLELYQKEWNKLSNLKDKQSILFGKVCEEYTLQDSTGYYIILS